MINDVNFNRFRISASKIAATAVLCLSALCFVSSSVAAQANLLSNPGLSVGSSDTPQGWEPSAFWGSPSDVTFEWRNYQQPPELEVWNYQLADSRWTQKLHLKPGWYHFTASVRTENVGQLDFGANISVMEGWISSQQVQGSSYWRPIGFYLQVLKETDVIFACRLGFYSSVNTGRAFFRDLSVTKVDAPGTDDPGFKLGS